MVARQGAEKMQPRKAPGKDGGREGGEGAEGISKDKIVPR
jgi:hypothetical protein